MSVAIGREDQPGSRHDSCSLARMQRSLRARMKSEAPPSNWNELERTAARHAIVKADEARMFLPAVAIGVGAVIMALLGDDAARRRRASPGQRALLLGGISAAAGLLFARWQLGRFFDERPRYIVEERRGRLEIRRFEAMVQAETIVMADDYDLALNEGFKRLAGYIFGGNHGHVTSPRLPLGSNRGERLPMTVPVTAAIADDGVRVAFNMPHGRDLHSLPEPHDKRVTFRRRPPRRVAVLSFAGRYDARHVLDKKRELEVMVREAGYDPLGEVVFAGYDAPSTIPRFRHNEVWVEIAG
jgi:hypothetical protein